MLGINCGITHDQTGAHSRKYPFFDFKRGLLFDKVEKNLMHYHHLVSKGHSKKFK